MPASKPEPTNDVRIQRLLLEMRNNLDAVERHEAEAARCRRELERLLPPESPLLDWPGKPTGR